MLAVVLANGEEEKDAVGVALASTDEESDSVAVSLAVCEADTDGLNVVLAVLLDDTLAATLADAATEGVLLGDTLAEAVADATTAVKATKPLTVGAGAASGPRVRYCDAWPAKRAKLGDAEPGSVHVAMYCGKHVAPLLSGTWTSTASSPHAPTRLAV